MDLYGDASERQRELKAEKNLKTGVKVAKVQKCQIFSRVKLPQACSIMNINSQQMIHLQCRTCRSPW